MTSQSPQHPHLEDRGNSDKLSAIDLSIIMPCFNESESIEKVIREWTELLNEESIAHEMIVVNDGSTDGTGRVLDRVRRDGRGIKVIHQLTAGSEVATRRGYELCRGKYVLHADASGRYEPLDFLRLWEKRSASPFVIGFRTHRLDSSLRRLLSRGLRMLLRRGFNLNLKDPNIPFRLVRRDLAAVALARIPSHATAVNLWMDIALAQLLGAATQEVPVPYRKRVPQGLRRRRVTLFRKSLTIARELLSMKYGNGTQPGLGKVPSFQPQSA